MERLGEVPVALVEKGKGPGSHLMSGAMMEPSAMKKLFPDLPEEEWPTYGTVDEGLRLLHDAEAGVPAGAHAAAVPQPRQPRHLDRPARALPRREGGGARRLHPRRDLGLQAARRGRRRARHPLRRQGPRARGRGARQLRARLRPDRAGHGPRRGDAGPPHRRRDLSTSTSAPTTRRSGSSASRRSGRSSSRSTASSTRWAGRSGCEAKYREFGGSLHLPDGRGQGVDRLRGRPRLPRRHVLDARHASAVQAAPEGQEDPRGRQARRLGREDDPVRRLLGDAHAALGAGHGARRATALRW